MGKVFVVLLISFLCLSMSVYAQGEPGGGGCGADEGENCDDGEQPIPLDDHIHWLVVGGTLVSSIYISRKNQAFKVGNTLTGED